MYIGSTGLKQQKINFLLSKNTSPVIFPKTCKLCIDLHDKHGVYNCNDQSCLQIFLSSSDVWSFLYSLFYVTIVSSQMAW